MRFFPREKGKMAFVEGFSLKTKAVFPFSRGKNRISQGVENRGSLISVPSLSFLSLLGWFLPRKTPKFTKDFLPLPNTQNPWKRQRKHQFKQGNSLLKIYQGNPNKQGKEGQGLALRELTFGAIFPGDPFNFNTR